MSDPKEGHDRGKAPADFIRAMIAADVASGKHGGRVVTRFPPEPNGYGHIGHAKSICLNFGVAEEFGGTCHLRFDDSNPETEDPEYVAAFQEDVRWLGFDWGENLFHASDYFERLYGFAVQLIEDGKAYVDSSSEEQIRKLRGTVTEPGEESPYRGRSVEENLDLFSRMRAGEFADGEHVLRAKIDMAAANMKMRDPLLYRIRHAEHHSQGKAWCIYPLYDFTHCLSDAIERITHSLCTLEFENNRDIYDWVVDEIGFENPPRQTEFARLNLNYTVLSKRKLLALVRSGRVGGWDDPRMPTLRGLRRRGYTPEAIRAFCEGIGVAKANSTVDFAQLEHAVRDDLNRKAPRVLCVLDPLRVVIENYPEDRTEELEAPYFPHDVPAEGSRKLPFGREILIEREDFREDPPKKFFRLAPGREVRLRYAYIVRCERVVKNPATGEVTELVCTYDPDSRGGAPADGRKVKGTIHWVSAAQALPATVRLYDRLFTTERPDLVKESLEEHLNPDSLQVLEGCRIEPAVGGAEPGSSFQFERQGFFVADPVDSRPGRLVFNRTVTLKDTWAKITGAGQAAARPEKSARAPAKPAGDGTADAPTGPARERSLTPEQEAARDRLREAHGLSEDHAALLASDPDLSAFYEQAADGHSNPQAVAKWTLNELRRELKGRALGDLPLTPDALAALVGLVDAGELSATAGKEVFAELVARGGDPAAIVEAKGLAQVDDEEILSAAVAEVLAANPDNAALYREGKTTLLGWFVGQVMRATGGKANPARVKELLRERLEG